MSDPCSEVKDPPEQAGRYVLREALLYAVKPHTYMGSTLSNDHGDPISIIDITCVQAGEQILITKTPSIQVALSPND